MESRRDWPARGIAALALILGVRYLVWRVDSTMSHAWLPLTLALFAGELYAPPVRVLDEATVTGLAGLGVAKRLGLGRRIEIAA